MKFARSLTVVLFFVGLVAAIQCAVSLEFERAAQRVSPCGEQAGFPLDDAWIHQVYARSFAERLAFEYNPGQPETGQSSLLWGALLAPVQWVAERTGIGVARATRGFGTLLWILVGLVSAALVARLPVPGARFGAVAAVVLNGLDPALAFSAVSGMEPLLLSLFALLAFLALAARRFAWAGACAGLAVLSRPEGILVAAVVPVCAAAFAGASRSSGPARAFLRAALPALAIAAVWVAFCLVVSGRPLPNTFYVKASRPDLAETFVTGARLLALPFTGSPYFHFYFGYLFTGIGLVSLLARWSRPLAAGFTALPILLALGVAATREMPEPEAFFWERYVVPAVPWLNTITAVGFAAAGAVLVDLVRRPRGKSGASLLPDPVLAAILCVVTLLPFTFVADGLTRRIEEYASNVRDVDAVNVRAGLWLAEHVDRERPVVIATQDAGAVRFFAPPTAEVVDLLGLNDHALVDAGLAGANDGDVGMYLLGRAPSVMCLLEPDPGATPFLPLARSLGLEESARFSAPDYSVLGPRLEKSLVVFERRRP